MLNLPLGSLYAFSVFLKPLEALLGLSRAELALVFALASAGFGGGANLTPYVYGLAPTPVLVLACATSTMLGITLAATAGNLLQLAVGYGLCFGAGGGAAYILSQQVVNLAVTRHHGLVNGYLVGLYPAGAVIAAPLFGWGIRAFGVRATLGALATALGVTGLISAWLITRAGVTLSSGAAVATPEEHERRRPIFWTLSLVFFLAASAGLMVLSQAAGMRVRRGHRGRHLRHDVHRGDDRGRPSGRRMAGGLVHGPDRRGRRPCGRARRQRGADGLAHARNCGRIARPRRNGLWPDVGRHGRRRRRVLAA